MEEQIPELHFSLKTKDLIHSFRAVGEGVKDLKTPFKNFGAYLMEKLKKRLSSRGEGSWPDYAKSTKERMEHTGTSRVTKFGKLRKAYEQKLRSYEKLLKTKESKEKALFGKVKKETQDRQKALLQKIERLRQQKQKIRGQTLSQRKTRKKSQKPEEMLGKLKRLKIQVSKQGLHLGLLDGPSWAWRHNEGDGALPKRQIVPSELDAEDVDKLISELEAHLIHIFEHPPTSRPDEEK